MNVASFDRLPAVEGWRVVRPAPPKAKPETPVTVSVKRLTSGLVLKVSISAEMHASLNSAAAVAVSENTTENALMLQPHDGEMADVFPLSASGPKGKANRRQLQLPAWSKMIETDGVTPASSRLITWMGHPALVIRLPVAIFEARKAAR
ncbi:hypothetical protein MCERH10_02850 [Caulobacteraceae bacterium]